MHPLDEMKSWLGFDAEDETRLREVWVLVAPRLGEVTDRFYDRVLAHPGAASVLEGPAQVERLRITLRLWCQELLTGPWDLAYFERRERIGRRHVEVGLEGRYMYMAMNVVRDTLCEIAHGTYGLDSEHCRSISRACDIDLAIMAGTYLERREARQFTTIQELIVSHLPVTVLLVGADGRVSAATGPAALLARREGLVGLPYLQALPEALVTAGDLETQVERARTTRREITLARVDAILDERERNFRVTVVPLDHAQASLLLHVEELTDAITTEARLVRNESLAQLGALSAAVAHELRNPLAGISGALQVIGASLPAEDRRKPVMEKVEAQVRRLNSLVTDLLDFARPPAPRIGDVDLVEVARIGADLVRRDHPAVEITIRGGGRAEADPNLLQQIVLNLVLNAAQAIDGAGTVDVDVEDGRFKVSDSGPGISPEAAEKVFQPFFTTRARGTGLGLPICRKLATAMGGRITIGKGPLGGASIVVELPASGVRVA